MQDFQLFVSFNHGDLNPDLPQYICVDTKRINPPVDSIPNQLITQYEALNNGSAAYLGISTDHCLLDISNIDPKIDITENNEDIFFNENENISLRTLQSLGYCNSQKNIPGNIDIILPKPTSWLNNPCMSPTYQHVMWYWWHRKNQDFDILEAIFRTTCPEYIEDLEFYKNENLGFPLGTFFMRSDLFKDYSHWMFTVIDAYMNSREQNRDTSWVESLAPQIMTRHLLPIYLKHLERTRKNTRIVYAPCTYFKRLENSYLTPAYDTNNIAIVLASDAYYAPLASVTIESIIRNASSENNYDLILFENGLTTADFNFLYQQVAKHKNFSLRILHLRSYLENKGLPALAHISVTALARFLIFEFLSSYSKIVYLDTDLVCTEDVAKLYKTDVSDFLIAAARDTPTAGWSNIVDNNAKSRIESIIQLKNPYDYFNSGVLVINVDAFLQITDCQTLLEMCLDKQWTWVDQDILNYLCAGKVKYLDQAWNYMAHKETYFTPEVTPEVWLPLWLQNEYKAAQRNPKIIHYAGRATPCFSLYSDSAWYFWRYAKTSPYYEILIAIAAEEMKNDSLNPISKIRREREQEAIENPLVTIIVPVYNSAQFLPELFDSLLRQTYSNIEIICVNDGSSDNSLEVLRHYAIDDTRIVVIDKKNSGAGDTRNLGMEHIRGKYICFVDSDDFIEEDAIQQLVQTAERNNTDVVVFGMDQYDDQTGLFSPNPWAVVRGHIPIRKVFFGAYVDNFYKYLVGFTVNKLYKSSFLLGLDLKFPEVGAHEDLPFTYIALSAAGKAFYLDKTLYHYRRSREGSLSDNTNEQYIYMLEALMHLKEGLIKRGLWPDYERNFASYALHMCKWKHSELTKFARLEFRDTCRNEWFERLGLLGHDKCFFFEQEDYDFLNDTINLSLSRKLVAKSYRRFRKQTNVSQ